LIANAPGNEAAFRNEIPAAVYGTPTMSNPGMKEQFALPFVGTLTTFQKFRSYGVPIGFAPNPRTGHECGDSRYLAISFLDACWRGRISCNRSNGIIMVSSR
jgi:hypothetical protein